MQTVFLLPGVKCRRKGSSTPWVTVAAFAAAQNLAMHCTPLTRPCSVPHRGYSLISVRPATTSDATACQCLAPKVSYCPQQVATTKAYSGKPPSPQTKHLQTLHSNCWRANDLAYEMHACGALAEKASTQYLAHVCQCEFLSGCSTSPTQSEITQLM